MSKDSKQTSVNVKGKILSSTSSVTKSVSKIIVSVNVEKAKSLKKIYLEKTKSLNVCPLKSLVSTLSGCELSDTFLNKLFISEPIGVDGLRSLLGALKLSSYHFIKELSLWKIGCGDGGIPVIIEYLQNSSLECLEIVDDITSVGCELLSKHFISYSNEILHTIVLDHNDIGDAGALCLAQAFVNYAPLVSLSMNYCGIGAGGGLALSALLNGALVKCKLVYLSLKGNVVGPLVLASLGRLLPHTDTLHTLCIADNGFHDDEEPMQLFLTGFAQNRSLKMLDISLNLIGNRFAAGLLDVLKRIRRDVEDVRVHESIDPVLYADIIKTLHGDLLKDNEEEEDEEEEEEEEEEGEKGAKDDLKGTRATVSTLTSTFALTSTSTSTSTGGNPSALLAGTTSTGLSTGTAKSTAKRPASEHALSHSIKKEKK